MVDLDSAGVAAVQDAIVAEAAVLTKSSKKAGVATYTRIIYTSPCWCQTQELAESALGEAGKIGAFFTQASTLGRLCTCEGQSRPLAGATCFSAHAQLCVGICSACSGGLAQHSSPQGVSQACFRRWVLWQSCPTILCQAVVRRHTTSRQSLGVKPACSQGIV